MGQFNRPADKTACSMLNTIVGIPTRINETTVFQQLIFSDLDSLDTKEHYTVTLTNHNFLTVVYLPDLLLEASTPPSLSTNSGKRKK